MQGDGEGPRREAGGPGYWYGSVVWSPDGRSIAYMRAKFAPMYRRMDASIELHDLSSGKSEVLQGCIGRNITDRALACVRGATTASEITDRCLQ